MGVKLTNFAFRLVTKRSQLSRGLGLLDYR